MTAMFAMPRLPAVTATVCPGRTFFAQVQPRKLPLHLAGNVGNERPLELLTNAEELREKC